MFWHERTFAWCRQVHQPPPPRSSGLVGLAPLRSSPHNHALWRRGDQANSSGKSGWGGKRRQLADKLGINHQTIGYIERGDYNPSLELALTIAELFRLPIEAIFSLKPMTPLSEEIFREPPPGTR